MLAALAATASAFVAPSVQAPRLAPAKALVEEGAFVPDMERRNIMNLILVFGGALPAVGGLAIPYLLFFIPRGGGGGSGGLPALSKAGDQVTFKGWLETHQPGSRELVQGLKGDATYLVVEDNKQIRDYGINAVCTHLGCVVPWNKAANKFMCPCHGSQYDETGKVVRGPAPLSLALAHIEDNAGVVTFTPWTETDFRTGLNPVEVDAILSPRVSNKASRRRWRGRSRLFLCRGDGLAVDVVSVDARARSAAGARPVRPVPESSRDETTESGPSVLGSYRSAPRVSPVATGSPLLCLELGRLATRPTPPA